MEEKTVGKQFNKLFVYHIQSRSIGSFAANWWQLEVSSGCKGATQDASQYSTEGCDTTAVSPRKISCLSQLAVRQKHGALREKPSMPCFFFHTKLSSMPDKCAVTAAFTALSFLFHLPLWFSRLTCIRHFLAHVLSGSLRQDVTKSTVASTQCRDWDAFICWLKGYDVGTEVISTHVKKIGKC